MGDDAHAPLLPAEQRLKRLPFWLCVLYLLASLAWVGLGDRWLILAPLEGPLRDIIMIAKGFAFVTASTLFLYVLSRRLIGHAVAAERREREQEAARAALFEDNPIPAWVVDANDHTPIAVNAAALHQYRMDEAEFYRKALRDLAVHNAELATLDDPLVSGVQRHRRGDGSIFFAALESAPTTFQGRNALLIMARDVSYEHQLEQARQEALKENQAALTTINAIMEVTRDAFWSWDLGSEDIWWTDSYATAYGAPSGHMPVPDWLDRVHPDDRHRLAEHLRALSMGQTSTMEIEHRYRRADDTWAEVRATAVAIRDPHGKLQRLIGAMQDVSEQRAQQRELRLHAAALGASREGVCIVDALAEDQPIVFVNRAFEKLTGYTQAEVLGRNCRFLQGRDRDQPERELIRNAVVHGTEITTRLRNYRKDGSLFWNELSIAPVRQDGHITHFVGLQKDVTRRHLQEAQGAYQSRIDTLTGLATHIALTERLEQSLRLNPDMRHAVLHIDVDRMAAVNEALGHAHGDELLAAIGQRLERFLEAGEIAARIGGDKFVVVLRLPPDRDDTMERARQLLEKVSAPQMIAQHPLSVTASIGISCYPADGRDVKRLMTRSEIAMQRAKWAGRNNIQRAESAETGQPSYTLELVERLRGAIDADALEVYYQPQISLRNGVIIGFEALLRWHDPALGHIPPSLFIPIAEDNGLVDAISRITLHTAAEQVAVWSREFGFQGTVGFNVSPLQSRRSGLQESVAAALEEHRVPEGQLEMEITENAAMGGTQELMRLMHTIADMGVPIAIDDFGTGYSNFGYLRRFPIHRVKIDRSFVRDIAHNREDRMVVRAIIRLAQGLGLDTIAEGVEQEEQAVVLAAEGCAAFQGFLYSPAVDAAAATELLRTGRGFALPTLGRRAQPLDSSAADEQQATSDIRFR
ncbi:EAL and GGDEF domain-containing protein [Algiphilus sp.]|uniref:sensor domain-containing protein n=1 Tax=Algiphilus sp. TaxID=1872431 RepID=UPI003B524743